VNAVIVRVAYAQAGLGKAALVGRLRRGLHPRGSLVVLADDIGHRALTAWVAAKPDGISLQELLDRPADDIWTTAAIAEELAVRLADAAGGTVTGVEIYPVTADPEEVNADTCAAWIELGAARVTGRLNQGLTLAVVAGAPVRVDGALMDRLAVPVPADDPAAPFRNPAVGPGHVIVARDEGYVLHVPAGPVGQRPRFEPRNMGFADGLDWWHLGGPAPADYSVAAEDSCALLSSAVPEPSATAVLMQTVFADDFLGASAVLRGEFRTENVVGWAGLYLRIRRKGWKADPDGEQERVVTATGSRDWSSAEISVQVPENADIIGFGVVLAGRGQVWLRNPELRRDDA
jgi:hypothetical protein